jgi:GTPase
MFVDYAVINVIAGTGGSGAEAFRREMGVPRGGPSGGNGGRGGDVFLVGDKQLSTLLDYTYQHLYKAERGEHGQGKSRFGADAEDLILRVPIGTVVKDADSGDVIGEIVEDGQKLLIAKVVVAGAAMKHSQHRHDRRPRIGNRARKGKSAKSRSSSS